MDDPDEARWTVLTVKHSGGLLVTSWEGTTVRLSGKRGGEYVLDLAAGTLREA